MTNYDFEQALEFKSRSEFYGKLRYHLNNLYDVYESDDRKCKIKITITDNEDINFCVNVPDYIDLLVLSNILYHKEREFEDKFRAL